eukprot:TRINITY_DN109057_c0_g1_i1.p1 TRINITY_DN109057_c0_g1~~TRINITY_DN109057_c0_g1_i1.p1  ORF type:complete len:147 (+),score=14.80 TRINITY_DN109057_c0_g1_i1:76-516(+)
MAPVNRVQLKTDHINFQTAINKERAHFLAQLPPVHREPFDASKIDMRMMSRSEYFPIGGRNAVNNSSTWARLSLGGGSYAASGGIRSSYAMSLAKPVGPRGFSFTDSSFSQSAAGALQAGLTADSPGLKRYAKTMSAPALTKVPLG